MLIKTFATRAEVAKSLAETLVGKGLRLGDAPGPKFVGSKRQAGVFTKGLRYKERERVRGREGERERVGGRESGHYGGVVRPG